MLSSASGNPARTDDAPLDHDAVRSALRQYSSEFLILVTPRGEIVASSEAEVLGYGSERAGHHIAEHLHPDDLPKVFDFIEKVRAMPAFDGVIRVRARHADGSWRHFETSIVATADPVLRGAVLRIHDITDRLRADAEARAARPSLGHEDEHDRFLSLAEALPLGIFSADARGWVVFSNAAAEQIFNLPAAQLSGRGWERAVALDDRPEVTAAAGRVITLGIPQDVMFRVETGMFPRWAHAKFVPLGESPWRSGWIATVDDVTDRRRAESQLAHRATHDALTGLPNRSLLDDRLRRACARLRRDGDLVTVLFVDLDGFKDVNDALGHQAGDEVLIEVGRRLNLVLREVDTVARLGGDEFVAVFESTTDAQVEILVRRISEALAPPMRLGSGEVTIGASIGVATTDDPETDVGELLARADQHMYRQKRQH